MLGKFFTSILITQSGGDFISLDDSKADWREFADCDTTAAHQQSYSLN